ncbi:MAG: hypothetical protein ACFFDF_23360 [Candidatus Odinarchaeota archaeon]
MKQLKFDKDGFILPQKINYNVEHDEETEEIIRNAELERELLKGLNILAPEDRDLKSLVLFCNPNRIYGPDFSVKKDLATILKKLTASGQIMKEKTPKGRINYSLLKELKKKKELSNLEYKILTYIDQDSWIENSPRYKTKKDKTGQNKAKYLKIKRAILKIPKGTKPKYDNKEIQFNCALKMLKSLNLITSRTEDQTFSGLVTTEKGHDLVNKKSRNIPKKSKL